MPSDEIEKRIQEREKTRQKARAASQQGNQEIKEQKHLALLTKAKSDAVEKERRLEHEKLLIPIWNEAVSCMRPYLFTLSGITGGMLWAPAKLKRGTLKIGFGKWGRDSNIAGPHYIITVMPDKKGEIPDLFEGSDTKFRIDKIKRYKKTEYYTMGGNDFQKTVRNWISDTQSNYTEAQCIDFLKEELSEAIEYHRNYAIFRAMKVLAAGGLTFMFLKSCTPAFSQEMPEPQSLNAEPGFSTLDR